MEKQIIENRLVDLNIVEYILLEYTHYANYRLGSVCSVDDDYLYFFRIILDYILLWDIFV